MIVGNPRSGTTFLHRYLVKNGIGTGSQLWQMLYPSIILQKLIKPFIPYLEKVSPTRYHTSDAHATSLQSVETDDVAIFFRYIDGFFLYVKPSVLSLVTGVLDKRFGFWNLPAEKRQHFINCLYNGLVMLLLRFHEDWGNGSIDQSRVFIVRFDRIMTDFDNLMDEVLEFIDYIPSEVLKADIQKTAEKQRDFQSKHEYDLEKFGLTEEQIKSDCAPVYETFLKPGLNS